MYPKDDFNQRLQLALNRDACKQVIIELQESYGDARNRTLDIPRERLDSLEYTSGVLEISYTHPDIGLTTEFITWDRVRGITFRDTYFEWPPFLKTMVSDY